MPPTFLPFGVYIFCLINSLVWLDVDDWNESQYKKCLAAYLVVVYRFKMCIILIYILVGNVCIIRV